AAAASRRTVTRLGAKNRRVDIFRSRGAASRRDESVCRRAERSCSAPPGPARLHPRRRKNRRCRRKPKAASGRSRSGGLLGSAGARSNLVILTQQLIL